MKKGKRIFANNNPSNAERKASNNASVRNCVIKDFFVPPITLRTPTSFERPAERPMASVVKLMHAISNTPAAIANNIQIVFGSTGETVPPEIFVSVCIALRGCRPKYVLGPLPFQPFSLDFASSSG